MDAGLLWCNLALLLAASVLPFPTAELAFAMETGTHQDKVSALILYAVVSSAMGLTWLIIFSYLNRHTQLLHDDVPAGFFRAERLRAYAGIAAPFLPVLIGFVAPPAALAVMVLTPIFYTVTAQGIHAGRPHRRT